MIDLEDSKTISTIEMMTTMASNWFMLSAAYVVAPRPRILIIISPTNIQVHTKLIYSRVSSSVFSMGYRSKESVIVFRKMDNSTTRTKVLLAQI